VAGEARISYAGDVTANRSNESDGGRPGLVLALGFSREEKRPIRDANADVRPTDRG
jgi:hypothetical protein